MAPKKERRNADSQIDRKTDRQTGSQASIHTEIKLERMNKEGKMLKDTETYMNSVDVYLLLYRILHKQLIFLFRLFIALLGTEGPVSLL